eukprot:scaffold98772_cov36-Phaeocystis_antarctica.AAC.1
MPPQISPAGPGPLVVGASPGPSGWEWSRGSGSSRWPCGKLVWWAPRHGDVARPRQVRWCAAGIGPLGSELASLKRMQRPQLRARHLL